MSGLRLAKFMRSKSARIVKIMKTREFVFQAKLSNIYKQSFNIHVRERYSVLRNSFKCTHACIIRFSGSVCRVRRLDLTNEDLNKRGGAAEWRVNENSEEPNLFDTCAH